MSKEIGTTEHLIEATRQFLNVGRNGTDGAREFGSKYQELHNSFAAYEKKKKKPKSELDQLVAQWHSVRPLILEYTIDDVCPYCGHKEDVGDGLSNA